MSHAPLADTASAQAPQEAEARTPSEAVGPRDPHGSRAAGERNVAPAAGREAAPTGEVHLLGEAPPSRRKAAPLPDSPHALALRPEQLARRVGTSRRNLYNWLKHPDPTVRLPRPFKVGRATLWRVSDIEDWLTRQAQRRAA